MKNKDNLTFNFVDAPTGYGKTTAIISTVNNSVAMKPFDTSREHNQRFLVLSPYLPELDRICDNTDCVQPLGKKQQDLQRLIADGKNICCSHSLFNQLTRETLALIADSGFQYHLIIDEEPPTIQCIVGSQRRTAKGNTSLIECYGQQDYNLLRRENLLLIDPLTKRITWNNNHEYNTKQYKNIGVFDDLRKRLEVADLYSQGNTVIQCPKRSLWKVFGSVTICSYRMDSSLLSAYCCLYNININYQHIENKAFVDGYKPLKPHNLERLQYYTPPTLDCSCSKYWYNHNINLNDSNTFSDDLTRLLHSFKYYLRSLPTNVHKDYYWTCFNSHLPAIMSFAGKWIAKRKHIPCNMKATNSLSDCCVVGYLVHRFVNVDISNFLKDNNIVIDKDSFALSELIQFVWRSNIRKADTINNTYVFIASRKLYNLFRLWVEQS
ncbi:hypothetical protein [uncultured Phascolarctobacterium sp.]|uniref:hypothetical protein n=1 Tax=uncultured Phascolarctobacterium sp. TaxID=512296 RepID=UPI0026087456|nr:hypothetical protein [uncultured Phascolarctobacterium sp.]